MTEKITPEIQKMLDSDAVLYLGWGLVYRVVCAPKTLSNQEISDWVSEQDPPGTSANRWEVTPDERAADHPEWESNTARKQCPDCEHRDHVLIRC